MADIEVYRKILRDNKFKITKQRIMVIEVLMRNKRHMKVEEIYEEIHKTNKEFGLATVYRSTITLFDLGIVNKVQLGDGVARYELNKVDNNTLVNKVHIYKICDKCGSIESISLKSINSILHKITLELGKQERRYELKIFETCSKCKD